MESPRSTYHPVPEALVARLARAERVAVLTGAGISAESGIPTFRDPGGLWHQYRPEELANEAAFRRDPALVQAWYAHRRRVVRAASPNAGHDALARLEPLVPTFTLVTQNVDGLHRRAGSQHVLELHGSLLRGWCLACRATVGEDELDPPVEGALARCRACGGLLRPGVVWFGEALPEAALAAAYAAAEQADVFLTVGTSGVVYPAAHLPVHARAHGAYVAEVNVAPSALAAEVDVVMTGAAGVVLPALVDAVERSRPARRGPAVTPLP